MLTMANQPQPPKSGTLPPQTHTRSNAGDAPLAGPVVPAAPGATTKVIVQGEPVPAPPMPPAAERLSKEQLQDLSDASKTTGSMPAKPGVQATTPPSGEHARFMLARARSPKPDGSFRRAGLAFSRDYQVIDREEIGAERAAAIEAEPMLEVRRISEEQAEQHRTHGDPYANASEAEVREELRRAHEHIEQLTAELKAHESQSDTDRPPRDKSSRGGW